MMMNGATPLSSAQGKDILNAAVIAEGHVCRNGPDGLQPPHIKSSFCDPRSL
jgi:hypothetical protein